jgi:hypothetical protein
MISSFISRLAPHSAEPSKNKATATSSTGLAPYKSASLPYSGTATVEAIR